MVLVTSPLPLPWESVTTDMSKTKAGCVQEPVLACRSVGDLPSIVGRLLYNLSWLVWSFVGNA